MDFEKTSLTIAHYNFAPAQVPLERKALCYKINLSLQQYSDLEFQLGHLSDYQHHGRRIKKLEDFYKKFKSVTSMDQKQVPLWNFFAILREILPVADINRLIDLSRALRGIAPLPDVNYIVSSASDYKNLLKGSSLSLQIYTPALGNPRDNLVLTQNQARILSISLMLMGVTSQRIDSQGKGGLPLPVLPKNAGLPEMRQAIQESRRVDIQLKCGE